MIRFAHRKAELYHRSKPMQNGGAAVPRFRSGFILGVQLLPGILLVLCGWGFGDLSSFVQNPARLGLAAITIAGVVAAALFGLDFSQLRRGRAALGSQNLELGGLLLLSLFLLWFLPFADRRRILTFHQNDWRYVGLLLCCIGVGVRLAALKALGECFSAYVTLQPNHRLVQEGIYGRIRHPLYLSLLLAPVGIALVFASWLALPIFLLAAIFVFDRIRREEKLLATHFGVQFREYRRHTWTLVPFVL